MALVSATKMVEKVFSEFEASDPQGYARFCLKNCKIYKDIMEVMLTTGKSLLGKELNGDQLKNVSNNLNAVNEHIACFQGQLNDNRH